MDAMTDKDNIRWVSASTLIEEETARICREFGRSKPSPRNKRMGFKGDDKPKKKKTVRLLDW